MSIENRINLIQWSISTQCLVNTQSMFHRLDIDWLSTGYRQRKGVFTRFSIWEDTLEGWKYRRVYQYTYLYQN